MLDFIDLTVDLTIYTLFYYLFINFIIANKKRIFVDFQRWHRVKYVLIKEWVLQYISKFENLN